jgi:hypothetical protein
MAHPSLRYKYESVEKNREWTKAEHIPWEENPLVRLEIKAYTNGRLIYRSNLKYEWRYKGKIFHRDINNNIWQKVGGVMKYIGIYNPANDTFDFTASEPRYFDF